jgi:hypothetical protein
MIWFPDQAATVICLANDEELDASSLAFRVADRVLARRTDPDAPHADDTFDGGWRRPR